MKRKFIVLISAICLLLVFVFCGTAVHTQGMAVSAQNIIKTDKDLFVYGDGIEMENDVIMPKYVLDAYAHMNTKYNEKGLKVIVSQNGATFHYGGIVNLNNYTQEDDLFQILVTPETRDALEFGEIVFKLTDVYDENNFITIKATAFSGVQIKNLTDFKISDANGENFVVDSTSLRAVSSWRGDEILLQDGETKVINPFSFSINPTTLDFYIATNSANNDMFIRSRQYRLGSQEKQGNRAVKFTTNEVYIDVTVNGLKAPKGTFYITKFLGKDLTGEVVGAHDVNFNIENVMDEMGNMPYAIKGEPYRIPTAEIYAYGVSSKKAEFQIINPAGELFFPGENVFIPTQTGEYQIVYFSKINGVVCQKNISLIVEAAYRTDLEYYIEDKTIVSGIAYIVETGEIVGGSGLTSVVAEVYKNGEKIELLQSGRHAYFIPASGVYTIKHTVSDYLKSKVYEQNITVCDEVVFSEIYLPSCIMAGRDYSVQAPLMSYVSGGEVKTVKTQMYVNGVVAEVLRLEENATAIVTFKGYGDGTEYVSAEKTIVGKSDKEYQAYVRNFFEVYEGELLVDSVFGLQCNDSGIAQMEFLAPISNRNLSVVFTPKVFDTESFSILFQGSDDANHFIQAVVKKNVQLGFAELYINGELVFLSAESILGSTFTLSIDIEGRVYIGETQITQIQQWMSGFGFDGFSENVYVRFTIENGAADTLVQINKIGNQTLSNLKSDRIAPYFEVEKELPTNLYLKQGEEFIFPTVYAYDVLQFNAYIYLLVRDSEGNILFDDLMQEAYTFKADKIGEYWVGYYVYDRTDKRGNESFMQVYVQVMTSTKPTFVFSQGIPTEIATGKKYSFPKIEVESPLKTEYYIFTCKYNIYKIFRNL